jgi:DNA (cytosine-5)-methyltransferase 1
MNVIDLFSGIGGFSLGLERAGMRTIAFCEIEPYCRGILRKHWPEVPIFEDVRDLHADDIHETVDLVCGGYPCQPFSVAGKRRGTEDDRHLWPEIVRFIRELDAAGNKPTWCLFENVAGHISMGLDQVLSDLEAEGYTCWPLVIPACALNAPHRRDRVWIIAHSDSAGLQASWAKQQTAGVEQYGKLGTPVAYSESEQAGRIFQPWLSPHLESGGDWRGKAEEWTTEPPVCGPNDGIPDRVARLRALGNAVVPQIPELIGRAIMAVA